MLTQQTVTHLRTLRLDGMARAFEEQLTQPVATGLAFEDRFGLLVDRELAWRDTRRLERVLKQAKLKYREACIEDLDTRSARGLDPRQLARAGQRRSDSCRTPRPHHRGHRSRDIILTSPRH